MELNELKPQKFRNVARDIERYNQENIAWLDIDESAVVDAETSAATNPEETYDCGTVACIAGHYAFMKLMDRNLAMDGSGRYKTDLNALSGYWLHWEDGADMLAKDLGFDNYKHLERHMSRSPEIWGNDRGEEMFMSMFAWAEKDDPHYVPEETLASVVCKLREVADTIEAAQKEDE